MADHAVWTPKAGGPLFPNTRWKAITAEVQLSGMCACIIIFHRGINNHDNAIPTAALLGGRRLPPISNAGRRCNGLGTVAPVPQISPGSFHNPFRAVKITGRARLTLVPVKDWHSLALADRGGSNLPEPDCPGRT